MTPSRLDSLNLKPIPKYQPAIDSPLLAPNGIGRDNRRAMPSPGISSLKEVFDVSNAINRMEEEGSRRRAYNGAGGAGRAGFLQGLNEEEDEEDDLELNRRRYGAEVSKAIEDKRRQVQDPNHPSTDQDPTTMNQPYQGWGGADRKMAEAVLYDGRAGPRDRGGKKKGGFELTLDKATLLGKRRKEPVVAALNLAMAPGSPMRVD